MNKPELISSLEERFAAHPERHEGVVWAAVRAALEADDTDTLTRMEETGGEPDVVAEQPDGFWLFDCSAESPVDRRSVCYDRAARLARKKNAPETSAQEMAAKFGVELLNEDDYLRLQGLGDFDQKSQSWIHTDEGFRRYGDALFGGKRHGRTFFYYNGVQSYYANRGFRCKFFLKKA